MSVDTGNQLAGHGERAELIVFIATGRAETTLASESNKFHFATVGTGIHGTTMGRVTTMNHLVDIFDDGRTRMKFVNDMLIIVGKNGL